MGTVTLRTTQLLLMFDCLSDQIHLTWLLLLRRLLLFLDGWLRLRLFVVWLQLFVVLLLFHGIMLLAFELGNLFLQGNLLLFQVFDLFPCLLGGMRCFFCLMVLLL